MKKIISYASLSILIMTISVSCDYVKNVKDPNAPVVTGSRKVLIEDYTGHKCGNCPAAADNLVYLENKYPGKIVPLAIHAGYFAAINGSYPTDFRNTTGNAYDTQFGISFAGNPNGLVNRGGYGSGGFIKAYTSWESELVQMLAKSPKFEIKIKNVFTTATNVLSTKITVKSLATNTGMYKLVILLSEDSVIAEQLDYRITTGSQLIPNYKFDHLLRGAINSSWGEAIFPSGTVLNDSVVVPYSNYALNPTYKPAKCHVIAYVYDADPLSPTYYEVLQVEEAYVQ